MRIPHSLEHAGFQGGRNPQRTDEGLGESHNGPSFKLQGRSPARRGGAGIGIFRANRALMWGSHNYIPRLRRGTGHDPGRGRNSRDG